MAQEQLATRGWGLIGLLCAAAFLTGRCSAPQRDSAAADSTGDSSAGAVSAGINAGPRPTEADILTALQAQFGSQDAASSSRKSVVLVNAQISAQPKEFVSSSMTKLAGYPCRIQWKWIYHNKSTDPAFAHDKVYHYDSADVIAVKNEFGKTTLNGISVLKAEKEERLPYTP